MPKYFFNIREGDELSKDEEGAEFPDDESARAEGEAGAREVLAEIITENGTADSRVMEVTEEAGKVVAEIPYKSLLAAAAR